MIYIRSSSLRPFEDIRPLGRTGAGFFMAKQIHLTQGKFAVVDDSDYEWLSQYTWHYNKYGYAARRLSRSEGGKIMSLHRQIMGNPQGHIIDHADGDGLNNQRSNLRLATKSLNAINSKRRHSAPDLPRGVKKRGNSYGARLRVMGQEYWLGSFRTAQEAAEAYDAAAVRHFGEFARLNLVAKC